MSRPLIAVDGDIRELNDAEYAEWLNEAPERELQRAASVRAERDNKLKDSDWTQVADAPVNQSAWVAYRQALRDLPQQEGFPDNVVWPIPPS